MSPGTEEMVILVDRQDRQIGIAGKMQAHRDAVLHRAFSVFLFDGRGRFLLQRRAEGKYHSGGLWTNTCCSHPGPDETLEEAVCNRLCEEMGIRCEASRAFNFIYRAQVGEGMYEHERDHVFVGRYDGAVAPNEEEVMDWRWMDAAEVEVELAANRERYTAWFGLAAVPAAEHYNGLRASAT